MRSGGTESRRGSRRIVECLEARMYLAGNVTVTMVGEDIVAQGDSRANCVEFDMSDTFRFSGCKAAGKGTLINGSRAEFTLNLSDQADILFRFDRGNDIVRVGSHSESIRLSENLDIDMGPGDDDVQILGSVFIDNDLVIKGRQGNDRILIALTAQRVNGSTVLQLDEGNDEVIIRSKTTLDGELEIDARSGNDIIRLGLRARDVVTVVKEAHIETHDGDDLVCLRSATFHGPFKANGGDGSDILAVRNSRFSIDPSSIGFDVFGVECPRVR